MEDKPGGLKTNEQIIEELTKDLESSCIRVDDDTASNDIVGDSVASGDLSDNYCERVRTNGDNADRCEMEGKGDTNLPKDFVDEDTLKDRELTLSEDEKEVCGCL